MWTLDKFANPEHAGAVFKKFYGISNLSNSLSYATGTVQSLLIICFLVGLFTVDAARARASQTT